MSVIDVTERTFEEEVLKSKLPVIADVWAEWCGPCRIFSPVVEDVAKDYDGKIKFVKIDADANPGIADRYGIMSIPTAILFENGKVKAQSVGAVPKEMLKRWIESNK